jgi:hypothetical protein
MTVRRVQGRESPTWGSIMRHSGFCSFLRGYGAAVLPIAALSLCFASGCKSACRPGTVLQNGSCVRPANTEDAINADGGPVAVASAADGGRTQPGQGVTTSSQQEATQPQQSGPGVNSAGSGGAPAVPESSGAMSAASAGAAAAEPPVGVTSEDPCKDSPGRNFCDGKTLVLCTPDGTTESRNECETEAFCLTGVVSGTCAVCQPGLFVCEGPELSLCDATGQYVPQQTCSDSEPCNAATGTCTTLLCAPNSTVCDRSGVFRICNETGDAWLEERPCGAGLCDMESGCLACAPGASACSPDGSALMVCLDDGSDYQMMACEPRNDCYTAACAGGLCRSNPRADGESCGSGRACINGSCVTQVCRPGETGCSGTMTRTCSGDGTRWIAGTECGARGTECEPGTCEEGVCVSKPARDGTSCNSGRGTCYSGECGECADGTTNACATPARSCGAAHRTCRNGTWGECVADGCPQNQSCQDKARDGYACLPSTTPSGCKNCTFDGRSLTCDCPKADNNGDFRSTLAWSSACSPTQSITICSGQMACKDCLQQIYDQGSFDSSCTGCTYNFKSLTCQCKDRAGNTVTASTYDLPCPSGFSNNDGKLVCPGG